MRGEFMPKKRKKRYSLGRIRKTKKGAQGTAKSYRADGYNAKIVSSKKGYRIMVRKKK